MNHTVAEALASYLPQSLAPLAYVAVGLLQCGLLLLVPFIGAMFFVWVDEGLGRAFKTVSARRAAAASTAGCNCWPTD